MLQGLHCISSGKLFRTIDRLAADAFKKMGPDRSYAFMITALYETPERSATPSPLAQVMNLDRSAAARLVSFLKKRNLLN